MWLICNTGLLCAKWKLTGKHDANYHLEGSRGAALMLISYALECQNTQDAWGERYTIITD